MFAAMSDVPVRFLRALADETRLRLLALLHEQGELCVCELTWALQMSQPKISRHLAILREQGILKDRRQGQWIYYRLHPEMPVWGLGTLKAALEGAEGRTPYVDDRARLATMNIRPDAGCASG